MTIKGELQADCRDRRVRANQERLAADLVVLTTDVGDGVAW